MSVVAAFEGEVHCEPLPGGWRLRGRARAQPPARAGEPLQLMLEGTRDLDPPPLLHDAEIERVDAATGASGASPLLRPPAGWVLRGRGYGRAFTLRAATVHLGANPALAAVLAPPRAPLRLRALAWLLLNLARIPGLAAWVARRRGG